MEGIRHRLHRCRPSPPPSRHACPARPCRRWLPRRVPFNPRRDWGGSVPGTPAGPFAASPSGASAISAKASCAVRSCAAAAEIALGRRIAKTRTMARKPRAAAINPSATSPTGAFVAFFSWPGRLRRQGRWPEFGQRHRRQPGLVPQIRQAVAVCGRGEIGHRPRRHRLARLCRRWWPRRRPRADRPAGAHEPGQELRHVVATLPVAVSAAGVARDRSRDGLAGVARPSRQGAPGRRGFLPVSQLPMSSAARNVSRSRPGRRPRSGQDFRRVAPPRAGGVQPFAGGLLARLDRLPRRHRARRPANRDRPPTATAAAPPARRAAVARQAPQPRVEAVIRRCRRCVAGAEVGGFWVSVSLMARAPSVRC